MTTIAKTSLPHPSTVDIADESVVLQSARGGVLLTHEPDPQVQPLSWTLHYAGVHATVADAIRRHYRDHAHDTFDWTPPGAADPVRVEHSAPPTINWQSNGAATCQVFLEEVPAYA